MLKIYLYGRDVFLGKEYEDIFSANKSVWVPIVKIAEYEVANIGNDSFVTLILPDFSLK